MMIPSACEVRAAGATLLAEVARARSPDGVLADVQAAIREGDRGRADQGLHQVFDLLGVIEAALQSVTLPEDEA